MTLFSLATILQPQLINYWNNRLRPIKEGRIDVKLPQHQSTNANPRSILKKLQNIQILKGRLLRLNLRLALQRDSLALGIPRGLLPHPLRVHQHASIFHPPFLHCLSLLATGNDIVKIGKFNRVSAAILLDHFIEIHEFFETSIAERVLNGLGRLPVCTGFSTHGSEDDVTVETIDVASHFFRELGVETGSSFDGGGIYRRRR
mmetsp:Transcript_34437/g.63300  ORF Transcript_34437/g.63300 Transcript_34437/m.63300 type:complete len:203 (-) Transcript_34437:356-964(-)